MQRLIVEVQYGDRLNDCSKVYLPVVVSSKKEFVASLKDKIKQVQEDLKAHAKLIDVISEKFRAKLAQIHKQKNVSEKEQEEIRKIMIHNAKLNTEHNEMHKFMLGGQTFNISNFVEDSFEKGKKTQVVHLPQVWTIDEYFAGVEKPTIQADVKIEIQIG